MEKDLFCDKVTIEALDYERKKIREILMKIVDGGVSKLSVLQEEENELNRLDNLLLLQISNIKTEYDKQSSELFNEHCANIKKMNDVFYANQKIEQDKYEVKKKEIESMIFQNHDKQKDVQHRIKFMQDIDEQTHKAIKYITHYINSLYTHLQENYS